MAVKILKGVWFMSLMGTVAIFMYVYASLPDPIEIGDHARGISISRNGLFYSMLGILAIFNALVFTVSRLFKDRNEFFTSWFFVLVIFLNLFLVVAMQFINLLSSSEKYDYDRIGFFIYGSIALLVFWATLWPFFVLVRKIRSKENVLTESN